MCCEKGGTDKSHRETETGCPVSFQLWKRLFVQKRGWIYVGGDFQILGLFVSGGDSMDWV